MKHSLPEETKQRETGKNNDETMPYMKPPTHKDMQQRNRLGMVSRKLTWGEGALELALNLTSLKTWDELHKASVTKRFVALRNATVSYQKALRSAL